MIKRMLIMLLLTALVLGGIFWFIQFKGQMIKKFITAGGIPVQTVSTMKAETLPWESALQAVGTVRATKGIDVSTEIAGIVDKIYFQQGQFIKEGKPLVQLRVKDEAVKLKALQHKAELARITYERNLAQLRINAISQQVVDENRLGLEIAKADIKEQQELMDKKYITAPFSGYLGVSQIDIGQYLNVGNPIVTLQQLESVYIDFTLPQQALAQLKPGQNVVINSDVYPEQTFSGSISVINPVVDDKTHNVLVRATVPNRNLKLRPGMYVTVNISTGGDQYFITLPRTAISFNPYGSLVYRVETAGKDDKGNPKLVAKQIFVTTGATRGDQIAVSQGLKEGDLIVTSGQIKLRNDMPVRIDNSVQPKNEAAPNPVEQ